MNRPGEKSKIFPRPSKTLRKKLALYSGLGRQVEEWLSVLILLILGRVLYVNFFTRDVAMGSIARGVEAVDPSIRIVTVSGYGLSVVLAILHRDRILRCLRQNLDFLLMVGWLYVSLLWSSVPSMTLVRFAGLTGTTLFGLYLGTRYSLDEMAKLAGRFVWIAMLLSLMMALLLPGMGRYIEPRGEVWSGAFVHKNSLGMIVALGFLFWLYAPTAFSRVERFLYAIGGGALLWFSYSRAAQAVTVLLFLLAPYLPRLVASRGWKKVGLLLSGVVVFGGLGIWTWKHLPQILQLMGRDPSLTGRTLIWFLVWKSIQKRFWTGYGFEAFWSGEGAALLDVWRHFPGVWIPTHSHNGLLELWLSGGAIAVGLFVLHWLRTGWLSLSVRSAWVLALWVFLTLYTFAERTIFNVAGTSTVIWVLYVAVSVRLRVASLNEAVPRLRQQ